MVFNHRLDFLFKPVAFPGFRSEITVYPYIYNHQPSILLFYNNVGSTERCPALIGTYSKNILIIVLCDLHRPARDGILVEN